jgi:hypothetical protein
MRIWHIIYIACLLSAFAGGWYVNGSRWESKHLALQADYAQQQQKASSDALTKQQRLIKEMDNVRQAAIQIKKEHDRNIADSRIASERLRVELDRIKALPAANSASSISERANAATDRLLLANLLGESNEAAGAYAEEADRLRVALNACNSEYEVVRLTINGG